MPVHHAIHTVGPIWRVGMPGEAEQLASCYRRSLEVAAVAGYASLTFRAIRCGVYCFPPEIAVSTVLSMLPGVSFMRVVFACFDEAMLRHYKTKLAWL